MRLRYIHLQHYPPIHDMAVCFASGSPLNRECAIRFVVGLNGSGKSNLLRAVTEVFLSLVDLHLPQFSVSLVYELGVRGTQNHRTLLLHCPGKRSEASLWVNENFRFDDNNGAEVFATTIEYLQKNGMPMTPGFTALIAPGSWPTRPATPPQIALPNAVLAYTTGTMQPWQNLWNRVYDAEGADIISQSEDYNITDERPVGWTISQELAVQPAEQVESADTNTATSPPANMPPQDLYRRPILLTPALLKCALLAVALPQSLISTIDYPHKAEVDSALGMSAAQQLFEYGGMHHLVSIAFHSKLQVPNWSDTLLREAHDWLKCAGEVIAQPHPTEQHRTLFFDLKGSFNIQSTSLLGSVSGLESCQYQGQALWALLGDNNSSSFEMFTKLVELHQAGLFNDVDLRLRKQVPPDEATAEFSELNSDAGVLCFEELSDGEQMVLGRLALFHLLADQQDVLLLLDEPETHFNDKWKREIVAIIDDAIGDTANDVLISTHSAIVLSDVFNEEIVMVKKTTDGSQARKVDDKTFATDPSALLMTVFDADDSIGRRAQEFIEKKLQQIAGTPNEIDQLEILIERMGSGFYRSELRTLLNTWRGKNA